MAFLTESERSSNQVTFEQALLSYFRLARFPGLAPFQTPLRLWDMSNIRTVTDNDTVYPDDFCVIGNISSNKALTLPSAALSRQPLFLYMKNTGHDWSITPAGADTLDTSAAAFKMKNGREYLILVPDGVSNWMVFSHGFGFNPYASNAKGLATLTNGLVTVSTTRATPGMTCYLTAQDTNTLGTPRVDNIVDGVSFDINSTGSTDSGVIAWLIES